MPATFTFAVDWNDDGDYSDTGEDVTARVLDRAAVAMQYGRDQARALSPIAPGRASFELDNRSKDYSPENASSPLAGNLLPARPVRFQATLSATTYTLFQGFLDDYDVLPSSTSRSVAVTCTDAIAQLQGEVTTDLYRSVRTGTAIGYLLDAVGWPTDKRDLDAGATTIRWWWEERTDGLEALKRLLNSEGPSALATVDADGNFVFRDRHHRLVRTESTTSQATFRDTGTEPLFSAPLVYDQGWRDVVNSVTFSVPERNPTGTLENVYDSQATLSLADGETALVRAESSEPFYGAVTPQLTTDYTMQSGTVTVTLGRTSGQSTTIFVKAVGGPAVVSGMRLRAYPVRTIRTAQVSAEDSTSISRYGRRTQPSGLDPVWAGEHDARAIAELILAQRAERLPIVSIRVVNGNDTRWLQQLSRDISDRITIIDAETGLSGDFYIEQISHHLSEAGLRHETVFGCEKIPTPPTGVFTFDVAGRGFNDGKFGGIGLSDPDTLFRFDVAGQGFNDGLLGF